MLKIEPMFKTEDGSKWGYVTSSDYPFFRVFLDGNDVSNRCWEADDIEGFVSLYRVRDDGNIEYPGLSDRHYGEVKIERWTRTE